jgi:hypothetical protein
MCGPLALVDKATITKVAVALMGFSGALALSAPRLSFLPFGD